MFAGKAHPADDPGKRILQRIFNLAGTELGGRIAFVENYGELLAQYLVHGVDVWLNNPRPPLEACGTSGMKASINGALHCSILDGWWPEAFNGHNGWAFGGDEIVDRDAQDAEALYAILEQEIVPLFYKVNSGGIPVDWVEEDEGGPEEHRPCLQRPPHGEGIFPKVLPAGPRRRRKITAGPPQAAGKSPRTGPGPARKKSAFPG